MSIDKALAILRARTPGRWQTAFGGSGAILADGEDESVEVYGVNYGANARAIVLAVNVAEAALAVAEAARDAVAQAEHSTSGALWHYEVEDLRDALAALDAAIEEETA